MVNPSTSAVAARSVAQKIAEKFAGIGEVEAVVLAGSRAAQFGDENSDVDLYVYAAEIVPIPLRAEIARDALHPEIGNSFWEPGDEWIDAASGTAVDVMFRTTTWIEDQLDRVLRRQQASIGYSTCFWYNVRNSVPLFERSDWFQRLQRSAEQPYPPELKRAILAKNYPILRSTQSSYVHQIELAAKRNDEISINHRITALLASYFDIVFAVNEQPHPGEKRLLQFAKALCLHLPTGMEEQVRSLLCALPGHQKISYADTMLDGLDDFLRDRGLP